MLKCPVSDYPQNNIDKLGNEGLIQWKQQGYKIHTRRSGEEIKIPRSYHEDMLQYTYYEHYHTIQSPTLIVHGDQDKAVSYTQSEKTASLLPHCQLEIIP